MANPVILNSQNYSTKAPKPYILNAIFDKKINKAFNCFYESSALYANQKLISTYHDNLTVIDDI